MKRKRRTGLLTLLIIACALFVVLVIPVMWLLVPGEKAQWSAARALKLYNDGATADAIELMEKSIRSSSDPLLKLRQVDWLVASGRYGQALDHCNDVITHVRENGDRRFGQVFSVGEMALSAKIECQLLDNQPETATRSIRQLDRILKETPVDPVNRRNAIAYYRSIAGDRLSRALYSSEVMINEWASRMTAPEMSAEGRTCAACGLASRVTGQQSDALVEIEKRIQVVEKGLVEQIDNENRKLYQLLRNLAQMGSRGYSNAASVREATESLETELAAMFSVKALLLDDLGEQGAAMTARARVQSLGKSAAELLGGLPDDYSVMQTLSEGATLLDTRGFVRLRADRLESAEQDLELAALAASIRYRSLQTPLQNTTDTRDHEKHDAEVLETYAVVLNHLRELYDELDRSGKASHLDEQIRELGFVPGDKLF